jgi:tetratricopeptide (TPR) repeat protein
MTIVLCVLSIKNYASDPGEKLPFDELFKQSIIRLHNDSTPDRLLKSIAELRRIDAIYPENWIIFYHISLFEIQQSFQNLSGNSEILLDDAQKGIDRLKQMKNVDYSEIYTLEGYYYYALIAKNPMNNGPAYYKNVFDAYQKALKYNPENPRTQLLFLIFKNDMAKFMGKEEANVCNQLTEIEKLFEKESDETLKPSWGEATLKLMIANNCKK